MKIIVLEGSPNKNGLSSNLLADCFKQGAEEAGHSVEVVDTAHRQYPSMHWLYPLRLRGTLCSEG